MMRSLLKIIMLSFIFMVFLMSLVPGSENSPKIIVDDYNCYWECCSGKQIIALQKVPLHKEPNSSSNVIYTLSKGENVRCFAGQLHTIPVKFIVKKAFDRYSPGDIIWVVNYLEEGVWEALVNGERIEVDLGFDPDDVQTGKRCELSDLCVGVLEKELIIDLWLKVQTESGIIGWTKKSDNFNQK